MPKKIRFELNRNGVAHLLKSDEMRNVCKGYADAIAAQCGEGYSSDTKMMGTRVIASAYTETYEAKLDNLDHNTLLRAMKSVQK